MTSLLLAATPVMPSLVPTLAPASPVLRLGVTSTFELNSSAQCTKRGERVEEPPARTGRGHYPAKRIELVKV